MEKHFSTKLLYPDLSYEIIGAAFSVFNALGPGLLEKVYQQAFAKEMEHRNIPFKRELCVPIVFDEETIGHRYLDFFIDEKIICELKCGGYYRKSTIPQVVEYLNILKADLAILINFSRRGVTQRRIIRFEHSDIRNDL